MGRSVVLGKSPRCARCQFPPRWCVCEGFQRVDPPLQVNLLMHHREVHRPTSTGRLIHRVIPSSRCQVYRHDLPLTQTGFISPDAPLWVLHPLGETLPPGPPPAGLQVLLLDGNWREATQMMHGVREWGRRISLPMQGPSRYWLRGQQTPGTYSTMEALLFLLHALDLKTEHEALRLQFELHVYAGLRARGDKAGAAEFLAGSPVRTVFSDLVQKLDVRRPAASSGLAQ